MRASTLPPLPLQDWEPSRLYLHLLNQIVGKIRLAYHPKLNHWWHATLYVSARGLTTGAIPYGDSNFDIEIDLIDHAVVIRTGAGQQRKIRLGPRPIADVYRDIIAALHELGIECSISTKPYKAKSEVPFDQDRLHDTYDAAAVHRAFTALQQIEPVFGEFRGYFIGKCSPVHVFWHSLDLAVTRFSGRRAPEQSGLDPVARDAYSHEVISAGFWFGDDVTPEPSFYTYSAPAPPGLDRQPLRPKEAHWQALHETSMALLSYDDLRRSSDPHAMLLDFLQSSYEAAANLAAWDRANLELPLN